MKKLITLFLSFLILISVFSGCRNTETGNIKEEEKEETEKSPLQAAVLEAEYPEMAAYPDESLYFDQDTGIFDDEEFNKVYHTWDEDQKEQRSYSDKIKGDYQAYFAKTSQSILADPDQKNPVYSPLSLYMALSMLADTTAGNTQKQILDILEVDSMDQLRIDANSMWNANYSADEATNSVLANSLWLDQNLSYQESTLENLANTYYVSTYQGEMGSAEYNEQLQNWINQQTGNLLEKQAGDLSFNKDTVLGLISTVYFQAKWSQEFIESNNTTDVFYGKDEDLELEFMNSSASDNFYWSDNFSAIHKNLNNSIAGMWFVLPDEGLDPLDLVNDPELYRLISTTNSDDWKNSKFLTLNLSLPKFDITYDFNLNRHLQTLGMTDAFDFSKADFSPLLDDSSIPLFLSESKQGSKVAIDEEGVSAASFTAMTISRASMPPEDEVDFVLDRPFLFVINGISGHPLFIGIVNQP